MNATTRLGDYPRKPAIRRAIEIARSEGIEVAGFEIAPGGVIRVLDRAAFATSPAAAESDFDRWQAQDKNCERHSRR